MSDKKAFIEVFHCDNEQLARMVMDELLVPQGIYATLHDRRSHSLPAPASMAGVVGVAVSEHEAARARQILVDARRDKVLPTDGEIVKEAVA